MSDREVNVLVVMLMILAGLVPYEDRYYEQRYCLC